MRTETPVLPGAPTPGAARRTVGTRLRDLRRTRAFRLTLIWSVPILILLAGGYLYLVGGRYVSTEDAFIQAGIASLSVDVPGRVTEIDVHDNERVKAGQVLFKIDDRPFRYAVEQAKANLAQTRLNIDSLRASYRQQLANLDAAQDTLAFQTRQLHRNEALLADRNVPAATVDSVHNDQQVAQQNVDAIKQQIASILANLGGDPNLPTDQHPQVQQAQAQLDQAQYNLDRTVVRAPMDGIVSRVDALQVGDYLTVGSPAFSLVSTEIWIEANFKETELTHMRPGDNATVTVDAFPGHAFKASVVSLSGGTGSEFSVLPPQNATGNWVKVTQRLPVRLVIDNPDASLPLRAGMSVTTEVDTGYQSPLLRYIERVFEAL